MNLKENSMIYFENLNHFKDFYISLGIHGGWKIQSGIMNDRGEKIRDTAYVNYLQKLFMKKKLFRRNVSIAEVVSFLDGYEFLYRIVTELEQKIKGQVFNDINIYLEYKIPYSKNRRVDFIFEYQDKLLLTEFRLSKDFPNQSGMWNKKELELLVYKELMSNYIMDKKIFLFAFIGMPEYAKNNKIVKNLLYNENNIDFFVDYLITYLLGDLRRPREFDITKEGDL
jgi:hypothetical protein